MKKWEDIRYLVFFYMCLVEKMEKWGDRKLIYLVEKKNEMMKTEVGINLQLYPH